MSTVSSQSYTEMHQYLDSDGSGTSATCVSSTIGAERLAAATSWLQANNLKGFLGEIGAGSNGSNGSYLLGDFRGCIDVDVLLISRLHLGCPRCIVFDAAERRLAWCSLVGCWALVGRCE